jgi:hemerythrin superfamily protein
MEQRIELEIDEDGKIMAKTEGLKGETCIDELQKLLEGIATINEVKKTDEYSQTVKINTKQTQKIKQ